MEFSKDSVSKIKNRIRQLIEAFIKDESLFLSQIGINPYTYSFQKSNFLDNIQSYFRKYGSSFRLYSQTDYRILGEEKRKINFLACLLALEHEGYIKIEDLSFSHTENFTLDLAIKIAADDKLLSRKITPPKSWQLIEKETKAYIIKDDQTIFTFPLNTSNKYRYFKCIWNNYGKRVLYKDIYEFESNLKYPDERGKRWHANDLIRNTVRKLKKEFLKKKLPFNIATNKGFVFTIQTEG